MTLKLHDISENFDSPAEFIRQALMPRVNSLLNDFFQKHCNGEDLNIDFKADQTAASHADRETERQLRDLIKQKYPDHGIIGEEFGSENVDARFCWVLDPLDGTREFLDELPNHFCCLIALCEHGIPVAGGIIDPLSQNIWLGAPELKISINRADITQEKTIQDAVICCTGPDTMFKTDAHKRAIAALQKNSKGFITHKNALGYAMAIDGQCDLTIESDLSFHDIAALIPPAIAAGLDVFDLDGNTYIEKQFDLNAAPKEKYSFVLSRSTMLSQEVLKLFNGEIE